MMTGRSNEQRKWPWCGSLKKRCKWWEEQQRTWIAWGSSTKVRNSRDSRFWLCMQHTEQEIPSISVRLLAQEASYVSQSLSVLHVHWHTITHFPDHSSWKPMQACLKEKERKTVFAGPCLSRSQGDFIREEILQAGGKLLDNNIAI